MTQPVQNNAIYDAVELLKDNCSSRVCVHRETGIDYAATGIWKKSSEE